MKSNTKHLSFDSIYVIQSLTVNDKNTGAILYDEVLKPMEQKLNFKSEFRDIYNRREFFECFNEILSDVKSKNSTPIIHFEVHGSKDHKGFILKDNSFINWKEIYSLLQEINFSINNNLLVTLAVCFGAHLYQVIDPMQRSPFWGFVGNFDEVFENDLEIGYEEFYKTILTEMDLNKAVKVLNDENKKGTREYKVYNSEEIFKRVYNNYLINICSSVSLDRRVNVMMNELIKVFVNENEILKHFKNIHNKDFSSENEVKIFLKEQIMDLTPSYFENYKKTFFMIDEYPMNNNKYLLDYYPDYSLMNK